MQHCEHFTKHTLPDARAGLRMLNDCDRALHELKMHDHFECVLKKDTEAVATRELFFSLMRFLRCHYPDDKESMRMVYIRFNMQREVAAQLVVHVSKHLQLFRMYQSLLAPDKDSQAVNAFASPSSCYMLTSLATELCNAARRFAFEDCPKLAADALLHAQLLLLQLRKPMLPLLSADILDIPDLVLKLDDFNDALVLLRHRYNTPPMSLWGPPVFHHTVVNKNWVYFEALRATISGHKGVYSAVLDRFLAYPNKMSVLESFKKFLNTCSFSNYFAKIIFWPWRYSRSRLNNFSCLNDLLLF